MKLKFAILLTAFCGVLLTDCYKNKDEALDKNTKYMSYDSLRKSVSVGAIQPLKNPGKIYSYKNYIFINEVWKGIHVYDNTDPKNIKELSFISIIGNVDMAVQNDILYADNAVDLVQIDISDITKAREIRRVKNVFPYTLPPDIPNGLVYDGRKGLVIGWN
ncbi:MAG: hypothetical protein NTX03_14355 [Bacteroidetes bacterium]|nr:hypothetical protein [Bacteroidota bacterium]